MWFEVPVHDVPPPQHLQPFRELPHQVLGYGLRQPAVLVEKRVQVASRLRRSTQHQVHHVRGVDGVEEAEDVGVVDAPEYLSLLQDAVVDALVDEAAVDRLDRRRRASAAVRGTVHLGERALPNQPLQLVLSHLLPFLLVHRGVAVVCAPRRRVAFVVGLLRLVEPANSRRS